ncbi:MAG TPA: 50S ribosomal protein L25 [Ignavibacteria bacterium]|nr:50S ribosomal protein L25 [Ignavibacteria bacterium]HQY52998.1 50S ribosomal protein L25 [Ignavibacteria bacterium]HRB00093.1 50S ribosomal protein L25 [Ignavibacteria bacterium]
MAEITLKALNRDTYKELTLNQLREKGIIPGIYYGHGVENISLAATEINLRPIIYTTESRIINLKFEDDRSFNCILKDVQFHPVSDKPLHFDLIAIKEGEMITIEVSVHITGNPPGVKEGGVLQHTLHKLQIQCLPKHIPSHIDVDVSELNVNDSIKIGDLNIENITILNDENASVVAIVPPTVEKDPEEATEEPTEPEVISKSKKDEESDEDKKDKD